MPEPSPEPAPSRHRSTLGDVAAAAGVSKGLASLALRGVDGPSASTRAHVQAVAARLGYRADRTASLLARRRTHLLGVTMVVRSGYHAELVDHVQAAADAAGYEVVLSPVTSTHDEERAVATLLDNRCEALLLLGPDAPDTRLQALAAQRPVVAVGRRTAVPGADVVRSADDAGLGLVVDHLVGLGHRDLALVGGGLAGGGLSGGGLARDPDGPDPGVIARDRRRGFDAAAERHGLAGCWRVVPGDGTEEAGAQAARTLLAGGLPTACVAHNDRVALGVLDVLARAGVDVPGRVSVTGYDDSTLARLVHVDLTSVDQDAEGQARAAVAAAVERLDGGRRTRAEVVLAPRLVVRGSTGAPPRLPR